MGRARYLTDEGLKLMNDATHRIGGCFSIRGRAHLHLRDSTVQSCSASGYGGAAFVFGPASLRLDNATLRDNRAQRGGALLAGPGARVDARGVVFLRNHAEDSGGAVNADGNA
eukprot:gene19546-biopygen36936